MCEKYRNASNSKILIGEVLEAYYNETKANGIAYTIYTETVDNAEWYRWSYCLYLISSQLQSKQSHRLKLVNEDTSDNSHEN